MYSESVVLSIKAKQVNSEIEKNGYVGLSEKYSELVGLIQNERFKTSDWIRYIYDNKSFLKSDNAEINESDVLSDIYARRYIDLVAVNIPRQLHYCNSRGMDLKHACLFETALFFASKQADAIRAKDSGEFNSSPAKINNVIRQESEYKELFNSYYASFNEKERVEFNDYVSYCREYSKIQSSKVASLGVAEILCHKNALKVYDLVAENMAGLDCEALKKYV